MQAWLAIQGSRVRVTKEAMIFSLDIGVHARASKSFIQLKMVDVAIYNIQDVLID